MKSIRQHITVRMVAGFGLLLLASGSAIYLVTRAAIENGFDASLRSKALSIMMQTEQSATGLQVELSPLLTQEFDNPAALQFYEVWKAGGPALVRSGSLRGADLPQRFGSEARPAFWDLPLPGGVAGRAVGLTFKPKKDDEDRGQTNPIEAALVVACDRRPVDRTLAILAAVLSATGALAVGATFPLVRLSLRRGHGPLEELSRQAAAISSDSLEFRFPLDSLPEELRPISRRLNDLLARLEASFERERRFSADLAHELRTPLAELRTQAEVGLQSGEAADLEAHREFLDIALQMQTLVTHLLDLSRCENGGKALQIESLRLASVIEEVWRPLAGLAAERQLKIRFDVPEKVLISTDRALFASILANLFSNAATYTPRNGAVEIVWNADREALLVTNTVVDLKPADMAHLFERLWRKDKSRTGSEHSGLGLSLAQAFAKSIGWTLSAKLNDDSRLTMTLAQG